MKTQRQSPRLALRLSAVEATRWCRLSFQDEDDSQDQRGAEQILQINDAADCTDSLDLTCMKCDKRVSVVQHFHNLSPCSLYSMIEVSAEAWHAILYLITPWQYLQRLGILFYILSRLGSIRKRTNLQKPKLQSSSRDLKNNPGLQSPGSENPSYESSS